MAEDNSDSFSSDNDQASQVPNQATVATDQQAGSVLSASATSVAPLQWTAKLARFRELHETRLEIGFFIGGFVFDAWMLAAPDELLSILQQAVYLFLIASLLHYEVLFRLHKWRPQGRQLKAWPYRTLLLHFLLGSLLSVYSIFYILSASILNSFFFLILMIGMLLANELPMVKKSNVSLKFGLYAICLFSYLSILFPIVFGFLGWMPFVFSMSTTLAIFYAQLKILERAIEDKNLLYRAIIAPGVGVIAAFGVLYPLGLIPPVPLSVKEQGVYHLIEKRDGKVFLSTERPWWRFWQDGDENFRAEPGDRIYYYAQIYSPARISDEVRVAWYQKDARGNWMLTDKIPMKVQGARVQGYRGFTFKSNYTPGEWKVVVETSEGKEFARTYFEVEAAAPSPVPRIFKVLER